MLDLKVRKFGNSMGIIIPKDMLDDLNIKEGDILHAIKLDKTSFQLKAEDASFAEQMAIAREGMKRYHNTLKKLAE